MTPPSAYDADTSPADCRAVRGMIRCAAGACSVPAAQVRYFLVAETQKVERPSMRYRSSILGSLLKLIDRRQFDAIVDRHNGNAYDKSFDSWNHLVCLIGAQLGGVQSLRELEAAWRAHAHHHYHPGVGELRRATLSDANRRRPTAIFSHLFTLLGGQATAGLPRHCRQMLPLIPATPVPLGTVI